MLTPPDSVEPALSRGPGVRSSSLPLVGQLCKRRVELFCCIRWHGRRRAWRTMVSPTQGTMFRFDPCLPGWFGIGWLACGLFIVGSLFLQRFGLCMVVLSALWLDLFAVGSFVLLPALARPGLLCRRRVLSWVPRAKAHVCEACFRDSLVSGSCRRRHVGCGVCCAATGRGRCVVLVRDGRSRTRSACLGLCCSPH